MGIGQGLLFLPNRKEILLGKQDSRFWLLLLLYLCICLWDKGIELHIEFQLDSNDQ